MEGKFKSAGDPNDVFIYELGPLYPATLESIRHGCTCPIEENKGKDGTPAAPYQVIRTCPVHGYMVTGEFPSQ